MKMVAPRSAPDKTAATTTSAAFVTPARPYD
jgi:hypothetical protein